MKRVPHQGYYGGAKTFRGSKRAKPAYFATEQFEAPNSGVKTWVTKRDGKEPAKP